MLDLGVIVLRLVQYGAASILLGSALFCFYALPADGPCSAKAYRWSKPLLAISAFVLAAAALLGLATQTAVMAGSIAEGLQPQSLMAVIGGTSLGTAAVVRAAIAFSAVVMLLALRPGRPLWALTALLGLFAAASLAWMGHGAATEGAGRLPHLVADVLHTLAAAGWIGAMVAFVLMIWMPEPTPEHLDATHRALHSFSAIGIILVIALVASGLVNFWFLVGTDVVAALTTPYGQLLALKLVIFAGMLGLAAWHRQHAVPDLGRGLASGKWASERGVSSLRRSLVLEAALGFAVLALVAWLGTLAPPVTV